MNSDMAAIDMKGRRRARVEWGSRRENMANRRRESRCVVVHSGV
jgi:hypothetical protein